MKNKKYMSVLAALSLLLPIGAFAQTSSPGTSGTTGTTGTTGTSRQYPDTSGTTGTTGTAGTSGTSRQYPSTPGSTGQGATTGTSQQYPSATSTAQHMGSQAMGQDFKRISEDKLKDEKRTAKHLMGKKIVDRDGQKIGEIKDIGLSSVLHDDSSSQIAGTTGTTGTTATSTPSASASIGAGAMTGRATIGMGQEQVQLYVELDDAVGLEGDDLAVIPASSLRFDSSKQELKLQMSRSEFASKLKQSESGSSQR